jgi:hypothetical protein
VNVKSVNVASAKIESLKTNSANAETVNAKSHQMSESPEHCNSAEKIVISISPPVWIALYSSIGAGEIIPLVPCSVGDIDTDTVKDVDTDTHAD